MKFSAVFCAMFLAIGVKSEDALKSENCSAVTCPAIPKHYEEFGCVPKTEPGKCCPSHFDCSIMNNRDLTKCHYGNETFTLDDELHNADIEASCTIGCRCRENRFEKDLPPSFQCTHIDCPEFFADDLPRGKKCVRQYEPKGCCSKSVACGEELTTLATCEFDGQTYYEGQRIDAGNKCYSCFCQKGFENKPVEENPHCQKINCNIELHYSAKIARGCIPVYYKTDDCCPIMWRCPDDETKIVPDSTAKAATSEQKCKFGELQMNVGDILTPENDYDQCTICSCKLPPFAHCIKTC